MRTRWLATAVAAAAALLTIAPIAPADAHTPSASDSCDGLKIAARAYGDKGGEVAVKIDAQVRTYRFNDSFSEFFAWDNNRDHEWIARFVANDGNRDGTKTLSGRQEACEKPPAPPKVTTADDYRGDTVKDCDSRTVTTTKETRSREVRTYDDGRVEYGPWSDWKDVDGYPKHRDASEEECPIPPKTVNDRETRTVDGAPDCTTKTVTITYQERTRTGKKYADGHVDWGGWSDWETTDTKTKPTTEEQCPTPTPTPSTSSPSSESPSPTPSNTPTSSPTPSPTATPSETPSTTPTPSVTHAPSSTPSSTPTPPPTSTPSSSLSQPPSSTPSTPSVPPVKPSTPPSTATQPPSKPTRTRPSEPSSSASTPGTQPTDGRTPADRLAQTGAGAWLPWIALAGILLVAGALGLGMVGRRGGDHQ